MSSQWNSGVELITPYVYKINTPSGSGTGFQISYSKSKNLIGIATANHVVSHEHKWQLPIELTHSQSGKSIFLKENRVIIPYSDNDLAFILFDKKDIPVTSLPDLPSPGQYVRPGSEIGWCGFPSVYSSELCFFEGYVSSYLKDKKSYLIDGVGINGVSGGPAFIVRKDNKQVMVCGVISSYLPNRLKGEALPGLCYVSSVEPYLKMIKSLQSLEEAEKKAIEEKSKVKIEDSSVEKKGVEK
ncbi:MAG TPA: serine protease [Patescibacteria group bacterium]|nr:serine protease [Patescibacteria group bacterium]